MTNCKNCGAPLDGSGICHYCGTRYRMDDHLRFEIVRPGAHIIGAETSINKFIADKDPKMASRFVMDKLAHDFAHGIAPFMEIVHSYDAATDSYITKTRLRVIDPAYRL